MDGAQRWRILRLHVEDEIPLAELARETKVSLRTLERWHRLFQEGGIAALDPRLRVDAGTRRTTAETVAFIERLALTKPRPSLATLHRLAVADARRRNAPAPGYSTVRDWIAAGACRSEFQFWRRHCSRHPAQCRDQHPPPPPLPVPLQHHRVGCNSARGDGIIPVGVAPSPSTLQ
jgi:transposase-like protein